MALMAWRKALASCGGRMRFLVQLRPRVPIRIKSSCDRLRAEHDCSSARGPFRACLSSIGAMYRPAYATSLSRSSLRYVSSTTTRTTSNIARSFVFKHQLPRNLDTRNSPNVALALHKPLSTSLQRYATHPGNPFDKIDKKHEEVVEHEKLEVNPEEVSATSSVHQVFHEKGVEEEPRDEDMLAGVKADLVGR